MLAQHRREDARGNAAIAQLSAEHPTPPERSEHQAVREVLNELSELDSDLLTLTIWERLTTAEAARVLGITSGSARARLHRVRARLERDTRLRDLLRLADSPSPDSARSPLLDPISAFR